MFTIKIKEYWNRELSEAWERGKKIKIHHYSCDPYSIVHSVQKDNTLYKNRFMAWHLVMIIIIYW